MARKTKAQKETEQKIDAAINLHMQNKQFNVMDLGKLSDAGEKAAAAGEDIDAAVKAACEKYAC